jgi:geranylgeranyl pyrophosphate synthase
MEEKEIDIQKFFENLFQSSGIAEGEAEILRVATEYTIFLDGQKIRALLLLKIYSLLTEDEKEKEIINEFINTYLQYQRYNQAQRFIIKVLESLTLKRFLGENWLKVEVQK